MNTVFLESLQHSCIDLFPTQTIHLLVKQIKNTRVFLIFVYVCVPISPISFKMFQLRACASFLHLFQGKPVLSEVKQVFTKIQVITYNTVLSHDIAELLINHCFLPLQPIKVTCMKQFFIFMRYECKQKLNFKQFIDSCIILQR